MVALIARGWLMSPDQEAPDGAVQGAMELLNRTAPTGGTLSYGHARQPSCSTKAQGTTTYL
jgi:hypothetical protein